MKRAALLLTPLVVCVLCHTVALSVDFRATAQGKLVQHPLWGISLHVPGFSWSQHPLQGRPNFILYGTSEQNDCSLHLSMFAIQALPGETAVECRDRYAGNPAPLKKDSSIQVHAVDVSPIVFTLYDQSLSPDGPVQNQLYGYWCYLDTCFELHVSSIMCASFSELALPILRSVEIVEQPDVTLATFEMGQAMDEDPRHWNVHLQLAGIYLHGMEPSNTELARRYYLSAQRLGGPSLPTKELWLMAEGIGLSLLMEDEGRQAIPYLERSVELARAHADLLEGGDESFYNLACAQSLTGRVDEACASLTELMSRQSRKQRKATLADARKDAQLAVLREAPCFRDVVTLAKKKD